MHNLYVYAENVYVYAGRVILLLEKELLPKVVLELHYTCEFSIALQSHTIILESYAKGRTVGYRAMHIRT